jgi:hypothetical protein
MITSLLFVSDLLFLVPNSLIGGRWVRSYAVRFLPSMLVFIARAFHRIAAPTTFPRECGGDWRRPLAVLPSDPVLEVILICIFDRRFSPMADVPSH